MLKDGDPGHGHKPTSRGLWGRGWGGRQRFPARGLVFGVGPGCLNQGLSLSLGWGCPSRFLHLLTITPYPSLGML